MNQTTAHPRLLTRLPLVIALSTALYGTSPARAGGDDIEQLRRELENARAVMQQLEQRIDQLEAERAAAPGQQVVSPVPPAPSPTAAPATPAEPAPALEVYGFVQADYVQDFKRVNPNWDDTLRPSRIPTAEGEFGDDGQAIISARQSRFGVRGTLPVGEHSVYTRFEIDMFGVGGDEGQTTIRLRHAYGEWGPLLAGQTHSLFMDIDVFPNTIDYWGPSGMVFLRNPQIRWTPVAGANAFAIAIEKPGNDIDTGRFRELDPAFADTVQNSEEYPDLTAQFRASRDWGHVQLGGILRDIGFETKGSPDNEPNGSEPGWGLNLSSNIKTLDRDRIILSAVYGEGIASYMNDGGVDLAPDDPEAQAVPLLGLVAYYDHYWSDAWSSSIGYSSTEVDNTRLQEASAFKRGQYASVNLLHYPADNVLVGAELLWGEREDNDGATGDDVRVQFSVKYDFSSDDFRTGL